MRGIAKAELHIIRQTAYQPGDYVIKYSLVPSSETLQTLMRRLSSQIRTQITFLAIDWRNFMEIMMQSTSPKSSFAGETT